MLDRVLFLKSAYFNSSVSWLLRRKRRLFVGEPRVMHSLDACTVGRVFPLTSHMEGDLAGPPMASARLFWNEVLNRGQSVYSFAHSSSTLHVFSALPAWMDIQTFFTLCLKFKFFPQLRLNISPVYFSPILRKPLGTTVCLFLRLESFLPVMNSPLLACTLSPSGVPLRSYSTPPFCFIVSILHVCVLVVRLILG